MDRKLQRHRADSLRQHGFLVLYRRNRLRHYNTALIKATSDATRRFTARCYAERDIATGSRPSVPLSVTLRYRDHIGWKSSKIISHLVSLVCTLSSDPQITDLLRGEHPEFLAGIGEGYRKSGFWSTKALISLKRGKIGPRLLLKSNRKSYTRFRLVPKSMTLDDLEGSLCTLFQNTCAMVLLFILSFTFSLLLVDK